MEAMEETASFYVVGQNHIWGAGESKDEALNDAEEWLTEGGEEMPEIGRHPSDDAEFNLARHGNPLDESDLADGNWQVVEDPGSDGLGYSLEALD